MVIEFLNMVKTSISFRFCIWLPLILVDDNHLDLIDEILVIMDMY